MSAERVAIVPVCQECERPWLPGDPERWRLARADVDELAWYCPECAEREFHDD